jgi:hypothetical protein
VGSTLALAQLLYYKRLVQLASTIFGTIKDEALPLILCLLFTFSYLFPSFYYSFFVSNLV